MGNLEARNTGEILALRLAVGLLLRYPRDEAIRRIDDSLNTHGLPEPLALKAFNLIAERDAFLNAYRTTLETFIR